MRSQRSGNRYLAGLVIVFSILYLMTSAAAAVIGRLNWVVFAFAGVLPALIGAALGVRAWQAAGDRSWLSAAIALVVLVAGIALSGLVRTNLQ